MRKRARTKAKSNQSRSSTKTSLAGSKAARKRVRLKRVHKRRASLLQIFIQIQKYPSRSSTKRLWSTCSKTRSRSMMKASMTKRTMSRMRKKTRSSRSSWRPLRATAWRGRMASCTSTSMTSTRTRSRCWCNTCKKNTTKTRTLSNSKKRNYRSWHSKSKEELYSPKETKQGWQRRA